MINKITFLCFAFCLGFMACSDDEISAEEQFQTDLGIIDTYLEENNISAQIHQTGLRYVIHEQGGGNQPNVNNNITINYEGFFLDGNTFDSGQQVTFPLSGLISGWQIGIPLINVGGSITLYIPSGYAYGSNGSGGIPANTVLIFDIDLLDVN